MKLLMIAAVLFLIAVLVTGGCTDVLEEDNTTVVKAAQPWGQEKPPYVVDAAMFTTTTTARARTAPTKPRTVMRAASAAPAVTTAGGFPCGGDLPPCYVLRRESLMAADPVRVWNGNCYMPVGSTSQCGRSSASGLWQFLRSTWNHFGGYLNAADAPLEVQNEKARLTWAGGAGCSHWRAC